MKLNTAFLGLRHLILEGETFENAAIVTKRTHFLSDRQLRLVVEAYDKCYPVPESVPMIADAEPVPQDGAPVADNSGGNLPKQCPGCGDATYLVMCPTCQGYFNAGYMIRMKFGRDSVNCCPTDISNEYKNVWLNGFNEAQIDAEERSLSNEQGW